MKKYYSKKAAVLLAILLTSIGMFADNFTVDGLNYTTTSANTVTLTNGDYSGEIIIPATVQNGVSTYTVNAIANSAFAGCNYLETVTVNDKITAIPENCFKNCINLEEVTLGKYVATIGFQAFYGCQNLESINLDGKITSIGNHAFNSCSSLTSVTLGAKLQSMGGSVFVGCTRLATVTINEGCEEIGEYAFQGCGNLTSIDIPNSVKKIGMFAFEGCTSLKTATIGDGVQNINESCFKGCTNMESVTLGTSVATIGFQAFYGCQNLESINLDGKITSIGNKAFGNCSGLTSVTLGAKLQSMGGSVFVGCTKLATVTINDGCEVIGEYAFQGCGNLTSIDIPNSVKNIGMHAFEGCTSLKTATVGDGVQTINESCFKGCTSLESVTLGKNIKGINFQTFYGCSSLKKLTCMMTEPPTLNAQNQVFNGIGGNCTLYIPRGTTDAYIAAGWTEDIFKGGIVEMDDREEQSLALASLPDMTYGDGTYTLPTQTNEGLTIAWSSNSQGVATISGNILTVKGAGEATITATQAGDDAYKSFSKEFTLNVAKAPLTITAKNYTIKQGEALPVYEVTYEGFKNSETEAVLTTQPTITCSATSTNATGNFDIIVNGATAQNYNISYTNGRLTIAQADPVTVTAQSYSRQYGEANPTFEFSSEGATLMGLPAISCEATKTSPTSDYPIVASKGSVTNYNVSYVNGTLTITKAPLTITAQNYTIKQGEALPTFAASYNGFKNGETEAVLTKQPTITCSATSASTPGTYDITVSGATAQNYNISYVKGTLTIVQADAVVVTANNYTREYGEANPTFGYTSTGASLSGTPAISCTATQSSSVGTYPIEISKGSVTNYNASYQNGTLTITKAPLTITAQNVTITQGETLPAFTVGYNGFKNGETATVLTKQPAFSCIATSDSEPGTYDIIVGGADAQNYDISYVVGKLTINKAAVVSVTAKSYTREYGEANPTFGFTSEGALSGTPSISCTATLVSPVGTYPIVASRGSVTNPNATFTNGTLTITKASLTVTARNYTITQGESLPTFAADYEGFKNSDTEEALTKQPVFSCIASSASAPGTYEISVSGAISPNYNITYAKGTLTIETEAEDPIIADGNCINGIYYNFFDANKTATVINGANAYTGDVVIPRSVKYMGSTYTVTAISMEAFKGCTGLTSISIPGSVSTVSDQAFYGCTGLTSLTIPDGVTSIGYEAFRGCSGLTSVTIGNDVKTIGGYAFYYCSNLTELTLGNHVSSIGEYAFSYCYKLPSITIPRSVTTFGNCAFQYCSGLRAVHISDLPAWCGVVADGAYANPLYVAYHLYLNGAEVKDLVIPNGVKTINNAFENCQGLRTVTIPQSVTNINHSAFRNCDNLNTVNIEGNGTIIGPYAFYDSNNLNTLNITGSIASLGECAFYRCNGLNKVAITDLAAWCKMTVNSSSNPLDYAGQLWLNGTRITDMVIPNGVTAIKSGVFSHFSDLKTVTIPSSVTSIGNGAFQYCSNLESVSIPYGVTSIGKQAFISCSALKSVTMPNSVTSIGVEAFKGCSGLTTVKLSNALTAIPASAFADCKGLTSMDIPDGVTTIGEMAFQNCSGLTTVNIPASVNSIAQNAFDGCTTLASVNITDLAAWNNISFGNEKATPLYYAATLNLNGSEVIDLVIPEGITSIGNYAFQYWKNLRSVVIGNDVITIGEGAFQYCPNLASVTIGSSVTKVGQYAFRGCTGMQNLTVGSGVTSIGSQTFYGCGDLRSIVVVKGNSKYDSRDNCNAIIVTNTNTLMLGCRNTVIPETVTTIAENAYRNCKGLVCVNIPNSVTSIVGNGAENSSFRGSDIKEVELHCSTVASWLFNQQTSLEKAVLGSEVTSIQDRAFAGCTNMSTVVSYIQEPFNFGLYAFNFNNTYNTCKLIVPAGTRDAYIAKGWTESVFKGGVVEMDPNSLAVADQSANCGKSVTIPIEMNNVEGITAFQFEVVLPEGVTWSKCQLAGREEDHVLSAKKQASGIYVVTAISMGDENFSGNSGAVANLMLNIDENLVAGLYKVQIRNIELTTEDGYAAHPLDVTSTLTIKDFTLGDTNGDGDITITDAVVIISYILGNTTADFVSNAADVNNDGDITITDAVAIIKMVLNGETSFDNVREFEIEDLEELENLDW